MDIIFSSSSILANGPPLNQRREFQVVLSTLFLAFFSINFIPMFLPSAAAFPVWERPLRFPLFFLSAIRAESC
jgi:hypothetical protein